MTGVSPKRTVKRECSFDYGQPISGIRARSTPRQFGVQGSVPLRLILTTMPVWTQDLQPPYSRKEDICQRAKSKKT